MSRRSGKSWVSDRLVALPLWFVMLLPALVWVFLTWGLPRLTPHPAARMFSAQASTWTLLCAVMCVAGWMSGFSRRLLMRQARSLDAIHALSWEEFERLVGQAYRSQGWTVSENWKGGADGGVDLDIRRGAERLIVQCKQWRTKRVPVQKVRELWGIAASEKVDGAVFVTCGMYTREAEAFARDKNLQLIDGAKLLEMIEPHRSRPENVVVDSTARDKRCPLCGAETKQRTARKGTRAGSTFRGCTRFPKCRGIVDEDGAES